jgi:uncharacterized protein
MPIDLDPLLLLTAAIFMLAGMVKGLVGMGLPTIAMGLLALVMSPAQAAAILVAPSLVTNVWQLLAGPRPVALTRRLWTMMAGIFAGTVAGTGVLTGGGVGIAVSALGAALILYAVVGLSGVRFDVSAGLESWLSPIVGVTTGLVTGATGVFVIPAVPYLQSLDLEKEELVQALGLSFTVSTVALAAGLFRMDAFQFSHAGASLLSLAPALGGMFIGQWLRERISAETFRRIFFAGLLVLGAYLALKAIV